MSAQADAARRSGCLLEPRLVLTRVDYATDRAQDRAEDVEPADERIKRMKP